MEEKNQKKSLKEGNGITLIALVVTIVVLLILAGVSISLVLSNNGVINKSKDARDQYSRAQENEVNHFNETAEWIEQEVSDNGPFSKYKVGDYVDYKPALETETDATKKTYSLTSDKSGLSGDPQTVAYESGLKWRILNINEDTGKIDIVAEPTTTGVKFYGATGYNNGVYALNDICEQLYSNKAKGITARSINLEDMEKNLTPDGFTERNKQAFECAQYGKTETYTEGYSYYPNSYKNAIGSGIDIAEDKADTITQPDRINAVDPYKESTYSKTLVSGYTKAETGNLTVTQTFYNIPINSTNYGAAAGVLSNSNGCWVASRFVNTNPNTAEFGLRCFSNTGMFNYMLFNSFNLSYMSNSLRLRAIVSLDSSVLTEKTGDTWSTNM